MNEGQDEASSQGQQLDQLQQELHAKELLLETLRYENNNLKQYSDRHYDPASTPDWKNYDTLKRKVVEYQKALEQRDHIIGQMEAGFKQLMHKNVEAEAKGRKAEEHYSGEIQTLAQQVQELTAQLTITSHQHQAAMKAAQDHFSQQLAASQKQMRDQHGSELASLREQHASEMTGMTLQVESLEKSHREEHHKLVEHLTHLSNSLGAQLEEEKGKVLGLQREKEEWEVHKKELEAESEERENLRRSLNEQITVREDLQEKLRQQFGRQLEEERKMENLQNVSESLSEDLKAENEKRKIVEGKLEEEMKNARKWFEEKTALEVNQKQVVLQLQVAEEELAKAVASSVSNCEKLERLDQENEVLIKDKESLSKENKNLTLEKELLEKEREKLISENQSLTKEKESLTSNNEVLTKEKDFLTLHSEALTKEKETLASEYKMLTKEKEAIALEKSRILADKKIKEKEKQCLAKEVETLTKFKDSLITEKDILLKEKQDSTVEKDLWTREKEALLAETEAWATEKENLLLEKESLLLEKKNHVSEREILVKENAALSRQLEVLSAEKEEGTKDKEKLTACIDTLMSEKSALLKEKDALLCEKELLISEKKTFSSEKIIWSKDKQNLSYEIDALCTEKKCWSQKEELLSKKNESLNAENKDLTEQNKNLGNEKEHLLEQNRSLSNEKEVLTEEREILMKQVQDLTTERESVVQLMEEVRSLGEVVEAGQVERKRLEDVCASKEAELEQLKEKYTQTLASKESDFKELEESYKKKLLSKDIELQELEENFKEKFSLKEKEIKELEEMYEKKCSQKDNELQELLERIALKESELEELKKKDRKMEILHENCLGLLEHLQSGEEERKKIEEECEDKCEMLNTVLRKVDVKLCEATSLVSKQRVSAGEKMQRAGPRSNLEEAPSKLRESETPHISMDRSKCEREMESCKLLEELHYVKEKLEAGKKNEEDLTKQLTLSEKEKKQLANEAEVMRQKIHDQHFTITSLQNEKSRLGQHIMQLEGERSSLRAEESRHQKYKLNMQKELSTLKAEVTTQKQKIKLLQEEMKRFNQAFAALTQEGIDCPEKLRDTLTTLNCLCSKLESLLSSEKEDDPLWLTAFSQELQTQWEHYRTTLDNLMDLQQHTDTLLQDKLEADLRNISLSAELDSFKGNITLDESGMDGGLEGKALEEKEDNENEDLMLKSVREENKVLKQCLDNKSLLLRLERLHLSNPKPNFEREMSLCLRERKVVMQVVRKHMEQFMAKWKQCAETHPSLPALVEALADCVEDLGEHLLGFSNGDDMSAEVVVRCLQQAMVRGVSKEYQEAISATLETLRQDLNHTLHHITLPSSLLDTPKLSSSLDGTSLQDTTQRGALFQGDDTQQDSLSSSLHKDTSSYEPHTSPQALTAKVEHLINVRTALVDAANEFNEELEEVLGQHLAPLKEQLQDVVKDRETSVREEVSSLPALPEHQTFIQEFTGFTSRVSQEAHTEKLQVLRNQQEMVHKILEDNQAKLSAVCHAFLESLHGLTSVEEMEAKGRALVDNLERTLAEEAMWVEKQYRDLLEHYTQEQDNNNQAHTLTCSHLVHTLTLLLHSNKNVSEPKELRQEHTRQVEQLCEEHEEEIQRLEAQLAAKDQETLQHLQGLYNDRDWYKKTVGLLSHVTLQLLHYYSVAQSLTHQPQEDAASPPPHPPESPTPGRILDLSFLSDCVGEEEEEMLAFSEDRALATGLMGRTTMGMEGEVEDAESALDGTAVSEGMMDDLDKDEQVRALLERSYPQLMAILKGRWDRVLVARLEKEVQELTISLQASAGMLRIFIHSVSGNENDLTPRVLRDEVQEEGVKSSVLKVGHSESMQEDDEQKKESDGILDFSVDVQQTTATKDITVPPSASILQQDLSCISEGLMQLLSQEESLPSFITLAPHDLQDKEQLRALLRQLCEAAQATASLKLELHHTQGLQQGLEEERHNLQEEVNRLTHYNKNLAGELQVLKDQLEETGQENQRPVSHYAAKMEATKDVRERVRVALSAKNVAELERGQLEARVRELEGLLEAVVRESETALETLRAKETDLSQQLEVADRQLKSARQFLEEHASDRDQEVEELVAARDKLTLQLRERDAQLVHHASQEKEVENLERQLWKKSEELQEALSKKEELQVENRASKDKICDLREIIQSLESQVDSHCIKEAELHEQVQELADALTLAKQQAQHLSSQVEELQPGDRMQVDGQSADDTTRDVSEAKAEGNVCQHNVSLLSELQEDIYSSSLMFRQIEKRLRDTTRGLEAMQLSGSLEDISAQDVEVTVDGGEGRLSPSTVDRRLEDQLVALECTTEVAIKRNKDLQITIQNLQAEFEEITAERDTLQERSREQLVKISSLEARLDEVRRADHPAAADMRQRLALLQEDLEEKREELTKKSIEVEELKHSLSSLREQLTNREGELQQLQSASLAQPHSLPQTAQDHLAVTHAQLEKDLAHKTHLIQSLQKELSEIKQPSSLSPSLAEDLILDKNAEISELSNKVKALMCAIQKVYLLIRGEGNLYEAQQVLSGVLGKEFVDSLNESEEQELLRRGEPEQMPSLVHDASIKEAAVIQVSPVPLQMSSKPGEDSVHTQPSLVEFSLMSAQTVPPPELSQVSEVTEDEQPKSQSTSASEAASSHTDSQAHLEEDFKAAQELLEAREAEILQLTEEVEDAPPMPLSTPIPQHPATQEMTTRLKAYEEQVDHLSAAVQRKSEEMQQLSTQLEHVHAEMKERLFEASREAARIEQQFQQQILDLKEQHIAREKKLCQDYEERVAKQVEDVAQRINKNKEAAMARQQEVFEATLRQAVLERDQAQRELEQWRAASASPSPAPQVAPPSQPPEQQTATQLCASVDALVAGLKQELEKAGQLDLSMASLMRAGEGEASTRASSVVSDASDGEEPASINGRIQQLMSKIHKDGIEVLSLIDIMFLCKHCTQLDTSQRSFIASSGLMASSLLERGSTGEQTQLMRNLAAVEEELAKMEQEMKRKIGVLEFQLEQERMSGSEWKLSFESEKQHSRDLMEQLRKERLTGAEHVSELTLLRSQLLTIRLQLQKLQEENISLSECQENKGKQIENLQAALQVERSNFSRVSKVLSEERKVSGLTQAEQEAIIKDLRNSLENERGRIVALCSHLERMTSQHSTQPPTTATPTPVRHLKKSNPSRPTIEELQVQLAVERERCGELERACERERLQAVSQKEQAAAERVQSKIEVRKAEGRLAELTRTIRSLETEKQRLVRQMSHEKERLQHQDSRIKELEGEVRKLEADSRAQSEVHQVMAERMREESTQLHVAYTRALTKLGEVEAEVCELRHKLRSTVKELQMAREHEEQLKQDLHSARTAVDRMGLPTLFRMVNQDGCSDLQVKANLELCRSMLQLTDDQRALRARIVELEDTVTSLNQQLLQAQESNHKNINIEEKLKTERQVWETEKASLQHMNQQYEAEVRRLRAEKNTHHSIPGTAEMQQLYGRYLQSEHWRKALVWQKQYLMLVIKGYSDTEQHTLARLTAMATSHIFPSSTSHSRILPPRRRFRVVVVVVVATCRMKNLVLRFHRKKRLCVAAQAAAYTTVSSPENSRPQSSSSVVRGREVWPSTPQAVSEAALSTSFTGLTPPTREPSVTATHRPLSATHRSLFQEDSEELNQYVERLDNIHSVLGLTHKRQ